MTKQGDLGLSASDFRLWQGDCLEEMKRIADHSVDMVLADPPYGTTACKWDSVIPLEPMWEQLKRVIKPKGAIVMTASQPFTSALVMSNPKMFKYSLVWEKTTATGHLNARSMFMRHMKIFWFSTKNRQLSTRKKPPDMREKCHLPSQKPTA